MVKLNNKKIRWIVRHIVNVGDVSMKDAADIYELSVRRVEQLVKTYKETGEYPTLSMKRRPKTYLNEGQKQIIQKAYEESLLGARLLRYHIQKYYKQNISHNKIHQYLTVLGLAKPNPKKQKKRKRCRYERKHSLSLVHADWLEHNGVQVIAYEDDASRKILSIGEFANATADNAILVLKEAESAVSGYNGGICGINTDRGSQFYANESWKKKKGISQFEQYLDDHGIKHVPSRRNNPQTNGKIERWFQEYIKHRYRFETVQEFVRWYNARIHGSLRLDWGETPDEAFIRKLKPESILGLFFKTVDMGG